MLKRSLFIALLLAATSARAIDYETPANASAKNVLPAGLASGPNHTVRNPVLADGYMYQYSVESPYGRFNVTGTGALRKLVHELWAVRQLSEIRRSKAFAAAAVQSATKPLQFGKSLITQPVDTLSGVPRGVGRLLSNVSTGATTEHDPSEDSRAKELLLVASWKRDYATRYDVDPYSSNPALQEQLNSIGWAGALGGWTATAATMPISGPAGAVMTVTGLGQAFNDVLENEPPPRIRVINQEKLDKMRVPADLTGQFLDDTVYTPRQDLILVDSLARLGDAKGRDGFVRAALAAENEAEANFFVNTAQIMRGYHEKSSPITQITMVGVLPVAQTKSGVALVPFALDHGVWTANADRISQDLKSRYQGVGFTGSFELWVTGTLSPKAKQELQGRGFTVAQQVGNRVEIVD